VGILVASLGLVMVLPDSVRQGEAVPMTLRLTNGGPKPRTVYLGGRPIAFDIVITRADGTPVWQRLNGAVINAILQVRVLAPGEVLEFSDIWKQQDNRGRPVKAGNYGVTGVLPGDPPKELRTPMASLRVL
jgi:hypothetical protein